MGDVENKLSAVLERVREVIADAVERHSLSALEYEILLDLITNEVENAPRFEDLTE